MSGKAALRVGRPIALLAASLFLAFVFPGRLFALDAQLLVDLLPTAALAPTGGPGSPLVQNETTRLAGQAALSQSLSIADGLSLSGSAWALVDSLPSGTPLSTPPDKLALSSRLLELKLTWEALPGTLLFDLGKEVIHPSSGFFKTPLNVISHAPLDNIPNLSGSAVGQWEEGWIGASATWLVGALSLSDFFSPRMSWSSDADSVLSYLTLQQPDYQNLTRVGLHLGDLDLQALGFLSSGGPGSADPALHLQAGLGLDTNLGESLTLRAEVVAADSRSRLAVADPVLLTTESGSVSWAPRLLAGLTWTSASQLSLMAEYYFNGLGFAGEDYRRVIQYSRNRAATSAATPDLLDQFGSFEIAQHYGFLRVSGPIDGKLSASAWTQLNLQDPSGLTGLVLTLTNDRYSLSGSLINAWGSSQSEVGVLPLLWSLDLEASLYF